MADQPRPLGNPRQTGALVTRILEGLERNRIATSNQLDSDTTRVQVEIGKDSTGESFVSVKVSAAFEQVAREALDSDQQLAALEWNRPGHGLVALIARQALLNQSSPLPDIIDALIAKDPRGRTGIEDLAAWPDTIKRGKDARPETSAWHFVDIPFDPDDPAAPPQFPAGSTLLSAIPEQIDAFNKADPEDVKTRLDTLGFVIHLIGDLHQPLHCATRITSEHPSGDKGGNSFAIYGPMLRNDSGRSSRIKELHALWDAALNLRVAGNLRDYASKVVADNPIAQFKDRLADDDLQAWALESHHLARTVVYAGIEEDLASPPAPSAEYLDRAVEVALQQGLVGGYRLARVLAALSWGAGVDVAPSPTPLAVVNGRKRTNRR